MILGNLFGADDDIMKLNFECLKSFFIRSPFFKLRFFPRQAFPSPMRTLAIGHESSIFQRGATLWETDTIYILSLAPD